MAKIRFTGLDAYQDALNKLGDHAEKIMKMAVYDGAAVVVDRVKQQLKMVVSQSSTGDLGNSIGLSKMKNEDGYVNTKLGFDGYDRAGHPNTIKARALEYGTSKQTAKPFIRPAVNQSRAQAELVMAHTIEKEIKKIMERKEV